MRTLIDRPPIGGRDFLPLSEQSLLGFRLHPGAVSHAPMVALIITLFYSYQSSIVWIHSQRILTIITTTRRRKRNTSTNTLTEKTRLHWITTHHHRPIPTALQSILAPLSRLNRQLTSSVLTQSTTPPSPTLITHPLTLILLKLSTLLKHIL